MSENSTEWFIEPIGEYSIALIDERRSAGPVTESGAIQHVVNPGRDSSARGQRRPANLYAISETDLVALQESQATDTELQFKVFSRKSSGAQIFEEAV